MSVWSRSAGLVVALGLITAVLTWAGPAGAEIAAAPTGGGALDAYAKLPPTFEVNEGQADAAVRFVSRGPGYWLLVTPSESVLVLQPKRQPSGAGGGIGRIARSEDTATALRMTLVGARPSPALAGGDLLRARTNYFVGRDPRKWRTGIANYARVIDREVYSGIDLVYHGDQGRLEYDFVVAPGADPGAIGIEIGGADHLEIDARGDLVIQAAGGSLIQRAPVVYQEVAGARRTVAGRYLMKGERRVAFEVGDYDRRFALVIDPALVYSTFLGPGLGDAQRIAVDSSGNVYVTGWALVPAPGTNPSIGPGGGYDAYVVKLDPSKAGAASLVYTTYFGGGDSDLPLALAVDGGGNAYVGGATVSTDFPTTPGAFQPVASGGSCPAGFPCTDGFVTKLDPTGSTLVYSTYLGGVGGNPDDVTGIAVDAVGNAHVTGNTNSTTFPTTPGAFQPSLAPGGCGDFACADAFVAELDATGSSLLYSTYLGGTGYDLSLDIAVDALGNAYVVGRTFSTDFPVANAAQPASGGGGEDAFVAKLDPSLAGAASLAYSTYLGGTGAELGAGIAVDASGHAYVAGRTTSIDFPVTAGAYRTTAPGGGSDAFVTKLDPAAAGSASLVYSTYLGGSAADEASGIAVGASGAAYVVGVTVSTDFPVASPVQAAFGGGTCGFFQTFPCPDAFVTKLDPSGSGLEYSTYLGGSAFDRGNDIAVDSLGNAYVVGVTGSADFPTVNAYRSTIAGGGPGGGFPTDSFVAKIDNSPPVSADLALAKSDSPDPVGLGGTLTYVLTVSDLGPGAAHGVTLTDTLPATVTVVSATPSQGTCVQASFTVTCTLGTLGNGGGATVTITVTPTALGSVTNSATVTSGDPDPSAANNVATATTTVVRPEALLLPFASFDARLEVERHEFELKATFKLGVGNNGINPVTEDVTLQVGTYSVKIPAGSFTADRKGSRFRFDGVIDGARLEIEIRALGGGRFELEAEARRADVGSTRNPVVVSLKIGNDGGRTTVRVKDREADRR